MNCSIQIYLSIFEGEPAEISDECRRQKNVSHYIVVLECQQVYFVRPTGLFAAQAMHYLLGSFQSCSGMVDFGFYFLNNSFYIFKFVKSFA